MVLKYLGIYKLKILSCSFCLKFNLWKFYVNFFVNLFIKEFMNRIVFDYFCFVLWDVVYKIYYFVFIFFGRFCMWYFLLCFYFCKVLYVIIFVRFYIWYLLFCFYIGLVIGFFLLGFWVDIFLGFGICSCCVVFLCLFLNKML